MLRRSLNAIASVLGNDSETIDPLAANGSVTTATTSTGAVRFLGSDIQGAPDANTTIAPSISAPQSTLLDAPESTPIGATLTIHTAVDPKGTANEAVVNLVHVLAEAEDKIKCRNCKRSACPGGTSCMFDSNVFSATRTHPCDNCQQPIQANLHFITKMLRGPGTSRFWHVECAAAWYLRNPKITRPQGVLNFQMPKPELMEFLDRFVRADKPKFYLDGTAGCGKSNGIMYVVDECRKKNLTVLVLVYGVKAKEELLSRGLLSSECSNFHSYFSRVYERWVVGTLREHLTMSTSSKGAHAASRTAQTLKPTICHNKIRLIISCLLQHEECAEARILLLRPFATELANKARACAFGGSGPSNYDFDALVQLVNRYRLELVLEATWSVRLTQPQKLTMDRLIGAGPEARMAYAISMVIPTLELSWRCACQLNVETGGTIYTELVNEVSREVVKLPVIDYADMVLIVDLMEIDLAKLDRVLCDEFQDLQEVQMHVVKRIQKARTGSILVVGDPSQAIFAWNGVNPDANAKFVEDADIFHLADNYRCATSICMVAQQFLDKMGRDLIIVPMRAASGLVLHQSFHGCPIDVNKDNLVLLRTARHAATFFHVLKGKGFPVAMNNSNDLIPQMKQALGTKTETLGSVRRRLSLKLAETVPDAQGGTYEILEAVVALSALYADPLELLETPDSKLQFVFWLNDYFKLPSGRVPILVSTMHACKGLEASVVYIGNPFLCPLSDRVALGGWQMMEELCVAFVAHTRARDILCFLPNLETTTRTSVLALWDAPPSDTVLQPDAVCDTQETEPATPPLLSIESTEAERNEASPHSVALRLLGLKNMPAARSEVEVAVRERLRHGADDKHRRAILEARAVLRNLLP